MAALLTSTSFCGGRNAVGSIRDMLESVAKQASQTQSGLSEELEETDTKLEETKRELDLRAAALEVFKERIGREIEGFRKGLSGQLEHLKEDFEKKERELCAEIAEKEHQWGQWRAEAKRRRETLETEASHLEKGALDYAAEISQLRSRREQLASQLHQRLARVSQVLAEESDNELQLLLQVEAALLSKVALLRKQSLAEVELQEKAWEEQADQVNNLVLEVGRTWWAVQQTKE